MKGPGPLHIFAPASAFARPGFRFANSVCEPPAAQSAAFEIRSGGMYAARLEALWASKSPKATATAKSKILTPRRRSGPSGRFLYHFSSRPNLGFAGLGFRFCGALWAVLEPPAAQSAAFDFSPRAAFHLPGVPALRSAKALSSDLQPRKRGLRPAVTEGDKGGRALARLATAN